MKKLLSINRPRRIAAIFVILAVLAAIGRYWYATGAFLAIAAILVFLFPHPSDSEPV